MKKVELGMNISTTRNYLEENIQKLRQIFPDLFKDSPMDKAKLLDYFGIDHDTPEKYGLFWIGKSSARRHALAPTVKTLRPAISESKDWDSTGNVLIEGDNLEVLKVLQRPYSGSIKLIFIDPPYNTGKDFVYEDNFSLTQTEYGLISNQLSDGSVASSQIDHSGRFHTNWLNMIYPRLLLARELLSTDGSIFISIDDTEVANLRKVCDEVFGEENFVANIVWQKKFSPQNDATYFSDMHDHILVYAKQIKTAGEINGFALDLLPRTSDQDASYKNPDQDPRGPWTSGDLSVKTYTSKNDYPITTPSGRIVHPPQSTCWRVSQERFNELVQDGRIWFGSAGDNVPRLKRFLSEVQQGIVPTTWWTHQDAGHNQQAKQELKTLMEGEDIIFDTPKPVKLIERILQITTASDKNAIILDFFAGSGTTAHAVMKFNQKDNGMRKFICVQLGDDNKSSHSIFNMMRQRILRAAKAVSVGSDQSQQVLDNGFRVFKLDHSNLKSWDSDSAHTDLKAALLFAEDNIKPDRTETDVLYEVLLKLGLPLTTPIEGRTIAGLPVDMVGGGALVTCLARKISGEQVQELGKGMADWLEAENPAGEAHILFLDSAFENDNAKLNLSKYLTQRAEVLGRNWVVRSI